MAKRRIKQLAHYGNVPIERQYCHSCQMYSFVIDGIKQCCDSPIAEKNHGVRDVYMSQPEFKRRKLSDKERNDILNSQNNCCIYCNIRFGTIIERKRKIIVVSAHFDHFKPFIMSANNRIENFVASCQLCNNIKWSHIFDSIEEVQYYVSERRKEEKTISIKEVPELLLKL